MRNIPVAIAAALAALALSGTAFAETFMIEVVMKPTQTIKYDFKDRPHFILFMQREGNSGGFGRISDAAEIKGGNKTDRKG